MKKIIVLFLVMALCACSSDEETEKEVTMEDLPQKEVIMIYSKAELDKLKYDISSNLYKISPSNKKDEDKLGFLSIYILRKGSYNGSEHIYEYRFFDTSCPYDIYSKNYDGTSLQTHRIDGIATINSVICTRCGSIYSLETFKATKGPALKKGFTLIEYPATVDKDGIYHVTNPNYKE